VGEIETWRTIVRNAEEDRESFRQVLQGKRLFNALNELKATVKDSAKHAQTQEVQPTYTFHDQKKAEEEKFF
jgi:hypothetical protein